MTTDPHHEAAMRRFNTHDLLTPDDYTIEELNARLPRAISVIEYGMSICRDCGAVEISLFRSNCNAKKKTTRRDP